jgi:hypothetical protein
MTIPTADGAQVAELKAKAFSVIKDKMTMTMADGSSWRVQGTLLEKNYSISSEGQPISPAPAGPSHIGPRHAKKLCHVSGDR